MESERGGSTERDVNNGVDVGERYSRGSHRSSNNLPLSELKAD